MIGLIPDQIASTRGGGEAASGHRSGGLHGAQTPSPMVTTPRCEPWCWNINTYIYPKNCPVL